MELIGIYTYYKRIEHKRYFTDMGFDAELIEYYKIGDKYSVKTYYVYDIDNPYYDDEFEIDNEFEIIDLYNSNNNKNFYYNLLKISLSKEFLKKNNFLKNLPKEIKNIISDYIYSDFSIKSYLSGTTYFVIYDKFIDKKNKKYVYYSYNKDINLIN